MERITVYSVDDHGNSRRLGWFDLATADLVATEGVRYAHGNRYGLVSGMQTNKAHLYRTKGGKWVEHADRRSEHDGPDDWTFLTDEQAREWLVKAEAEEPLAKWFPDTPEESAPNPKGGRPAIGGPAVNVQYPLDLLKKIDAAAAKAKMSRGAWLRKVAEEAVA